MITLIITLIAVGLLMWGVKISPIPDILKTVIYIVTGICVAFYLLAAFGILHHDVAVPQLR